MTTNETEYIKWYRIAQEQVKDEGIKLTDAGKIARL